MRRAARIDHAPREIRGFGRFGGWMDAILFEPDFFSILLKIVIDERV